MKPSDGISGKNGSERPLLNPLDRVTLLYVLLTTLYIFSGLQNLQNAAPHFIMRAAVALIVFFLAFLNRRFPGEAVSFFRNLYPLLFIGYFYTETSFLKNILIGTNLDAHLSALEASVFGCQPSLCFSKAIPYKWFNELMNICYFSYYLMTAGVCISLYFLKRKESFRDVFIVVFSFYMYYAIYALFPVTGPQFYFSPAEIEMDHPYLFGKIMHYILTNVEEPTGAFPSSHVGVALILSWVAYRHLKKLFWWVLPFTLGICFATVYLKAHYLLDVIAGFISAPVFIFISSALYSRLTRHYKPEEASPALPGQ